jgi:hypothetical protein
MWLNEVKKRLRDGTYRTFEAYSSDMRLIWQNAKEFNHPQDPLYALAEVAEERFLKKMQALPKTREEEYISKLTKLSGRIAALTLAFQRELDHTSSAALGG